MGGETKILYTSIPKISDLAYYIALIDPKEPRDPSAPSEFQWQTLKSRFFIWKNADVLAAPIQKRTSQIHVIISKDKSYTLPEKLKADKLILSGPYRLEDYVYQECLSYTLAFRMAPQWQKINNFFLHSSEFLTSEDPMESVKFELEVSPNEGKLSIKVSMHRVKLPLLNLDSLGVNIESLKTTGFANTNATVYILPKLTKGTAVNISVKIPDGCPFSSYSQLRRHWKNTHGYHLPHDEEGMLYVSVNFGWNNIPYSYPIVCTRSGKLHLLKSRHPDLVLYKFGENIMRKMPSICGKPVDIVVRDDGSVFPLAELNPEGQNENKKTTTVSSRKTTKSVPKAIQDKTVADDTEEIEISQVTDFDVQDNTVVVLDQDLPSQAAAQPMEPLNVNLITPAKTSAFVSTTSTPLPSTSVVRNVSFTPILSPITNDQPTVIRSLSQPVPIRPLVQPIPIKPLTEVHAAKRPITVSMDALKSAGLVLINEEPAPKRPALDSVENMNSRNVIVQNQGSEIETLARSKSLHSLTIPVLKTFCQQNGIQVSYRDKKDAIVQKVYDHFGV